MKYSLHITPEIQNLMNNNALFVLNDSAGKDSQAMKVLLRRTIPENQLVIVHANLPGVEWEGNMDHIRKYSGQVPIFEVEAGKTFFDMVERRWNTRPEVPSWPGASTRQCTSDLKRGPIQKFINKYARENGFSIVVNCMGLRAQESNSRAKKNPFRYMPDKSAKHRQQYEWLPIHDMLAVEVWATIAEAGQEPHYAYGLGMNRLSCCICILACDSDIRIGAKHNPVVAAKYIEWEEKTGYTLSMSRRPLKEILS